MKPEKVQYIKDKKDYKVSLQSKLQCKCEKWRATYNYGQSDHSDNILI